VERGRLVRSRWPSLAGDRSVTGRGRPVTAGGSPALRSFAVCAAQDDT